MIRQLGIIGYPLTHSISPVFQQAAFDYEGIDAKYSLWEIPPNKLSECLDWVRSQDVLGFNVTIPYKESIIPLLDDIDESAQQIGAVNTVLAKNDRLVGFNTDAEGFRRSLTEEAMFQIRGSFPIILGAGGSARAVATTLVKEGAARVIIANRSRERSESLAYNLRVQFDSEVHGVDLSYATLRHYLKGSHAPNIVVNCTAVGMAHGPDPDGSLLPEDLVPSTALIYDLVYNPQETPLLRGARNAGARVMGGLSMLIYQGAAGFFMWTGTHPKIEIMRSAAYRALE
ncbi:MAG: shikimate dehydrogenase [SAR202 cluster bacterium]|mgnify:CR=1 FL=1|nr:shikimate dehydrogenase [SAR202 cluster bacterium]